MSIKVERPRKVQDIFNPESSESQTKTKRQKVQTRNIVLLRCAACIFSKPQDWILMFISFVSDSFSELEWTNGQCDEEAFPPFLSLHYKD